MNNDEFNIFQGDLIKDNSTNLIYRIYCISGPKAYMCVFKNKLRYSLILSQIDVKELISNLIQKNYTKLYETKKTIIFSTLSSQEFKKYEQRKNMISELSQFYGPTFMNISLKKNRQNIISIYKKYNFHIDVGRRWLNRFIQSGCDYNSLTSAYINNNSRNTNYTYKTKAGRNNCTKYNKTGVIRNDYLIESFELGINIFFHGPNLDNAKHRTMTIMMAYKEMLLQRYNEFAINKDGSSYKLVPPDQRPTYKQFYYFFKQRVSKKDEIISKTSHLEFRNNYRLRKSDTLKNNQGPMDICEIDAWESNVVLISEYNNNQILGKPTVYAMIDSYSKMIIAISISFERDSYIGLTNLFLNLTGDIKDRLENKGLHYERFNLVSNYLPNIVRTDNGSDFISNNFSKVLNKLNIIHQTVPSASGSLKGNIERLWGRIDKEINIYIENNGYMLKRIDDNSYKTACFNITEYTDLIYKVAIGLNEREISDYPMDAELISYRDEYGNPIKPSPINLWNYGLKNKMNPRRITDNKQYFFNLLIDGIASLSNNGINFKSINYFPNDEDLSIIKKMYLLGKKREKILIHYDPRNMNFIWHVDSKNEIHTFKLNQEKSNSEGFLNKSFEECMFFINQRKIISNNSVNQNIEKDIEIMHDTKQIINIYKPSKKIKNEKTSFSDIKHNRKQEKFNKRKDENIHNLLNSNKAFSLEGEENNNSSINQSNSNNNDDNEPKQNLDDFLIDNYGY